MTSKIFKNILIFISAAYFLVAGTGYNIVNYCCNSCSEIGIEAIAISSCKHVHENSESDCCDSGDNDLACTNPTHVPLSCHLLRLSTDIPSLDSTLSFNFYPSTAILLFFTDVLFDISNFKATKIDIPPLLNFSSSGREILALNNVLLI